MTTIPVKFGNTLGRSRPEVGSGFPIEAYGSRGVSLIFSTSDEKCIPITIFKGRKLNCY